MRFFYLEHWREKPDPITASTEQRATSIERGRCCQRWWGLMEGRVPSRPARPQTTSLLLRATKQQRCTWRRRWPGWNPALHRPHRVVAMHWVIADGKRWVGVVEGRVPSRPARPQATSLLLRGTLQQRCTLATPLAGMEPGPPSATPRGCYALGYSRRQALGGSCGRSSSISTSAPTDHIPLAARHTTTAVYLLAPLAGMEPGPPSGSSGGC